MTRKRSGKRLLFILVSVVLPLVSGALVYFFFCPEVLFVRKLGGLPGIGERAVNAVPAPGLLRFIRNYGLDFLWAFSLTNSLFLILKNSAKAALSAALVSFFLGAAMEILQFAGIAAGTGDLGDMVSEGLGALAGALLILKWRKYL